MNKENILSMVQAHQRWISDGTDGDRFEVTGLSQTGLDLSKSNLTAAIIVESKLPLTNFSSTNLQECCLIGSSFEGSNFSDAVLTKADVSGGSLNSILGTNLVARRFEVTNVDFDNAILRKADLSGSLFVDVSFKGTNFTNANLADTFFLRCDLTGAILAGARESETLKAKDIKIDDSGTPLDAAASEAWFRSKI